MSASSTNFVMTGYRKETSRYQTASSTFSNIENRLQLKPDCMVKIQTAPDQYVTGRVLVILDRYFTVCINETTLTALCVFRENWSEVELLSL